MHSQSPVQKRTVQHILWVTFDLLKSNYFDVLTVQQICEEAEINRSTFYRYFEDKYDLLYHLSQLIGQQFEKRSKNTENNLDSFVSYFDENKKVFKHLITSERSIDVLNEIKRIHSKMMLEASRFNDDEVARKVRESKHPEMLCDFMSSGVVEILRNWVNNKYEQGTEALFDFLNDRMNSV
ncbi:TetR/AcrR family transcriptional regulator [Staphylococcus sp. SQ8-PEA]|uniref:TetR/AcrR family transcriptional regulator n=1 Tax=Staphylococcus marylandisciuri TaxID=2981529 RepID=A0ABT2QQS6_9STAP|nr:TetR/AcrR family transcriptional regulator [Staphylococcus marylandisciuri]MCU5746331.1 TetR/AcrR family transcriptional regulator [Staphylococcus marylandisciuri]